jgi:mRNA-degrading endonuclease toxin of MazEF toxin-antitoxin module
MTVGDIHWVQLPAANGHEQRGRRPAVIFQDDAYA